MSDETEADIVLQLDTLATYAERADHWVGDKRLMGAAGVADTLYGAIDRIKELEAKLAKALTGLHECEEEIDAYIRHEYPGDHPVHARYRKRDFDANPARIAIAELKGQDDE